MASALRSSRVNMQQIDISDFTFSLNPSSCQTPSPALIASIKRFGILHPPILRETKMGAYQIVTGRLRILAIGEILPAMSLPCLLLPNDCTDIEALSINLEDTLLRGGISLIEQAIFFQKVLGRLDEEVAARNFLPLLGYKQHPRIIKDLVSLLNLEEPLQHGVHCGFLHEGVARELLKCSFADRLVLFEIIETLGLSVGSQKKFVAMSKELALRHNTSIIAILSDSEIKDILQNRESNPPQKAANILRVLNERCHPLLTSAEQEYRSFVGKLMLPQGVNVEHAPSFERDTLTLSIQFKNREELHASWPTIQQAIS